MRVANSSTVMSTKRGRGSGVVLDGCQGRRGASASTWAVCCPGSGAGASICAGVPRNCANGPSWRTTPIRGWARDLLAVGYQVGVPQRLLSGADEVGSGVAVLPEDPRSPVRPVLPCSQGHTVAHLLSGLFRPPVRWSCVARVRRHLLGKAKRSQGGDKQVLQQVRELNPAAVRSHDRLVARRAHRVERVGARLRVSWNSSGYRVAICSRTRLFKSYRNKP